VRFTQTLGWAGPLDTRTLAVQLREVAKSYTDFSKKFPYTVVDGATNVEETAELESKIPAQKYVVGEEGEGGRKDEKGTNDRGEDTKKSDSRKSGVNEVENDEEEREVSAGRTADSALVSTLLEAKEIITTLVPQLYQKLNAVCGGGVGQGKDAVLIRELQGQPWIWVGDTFVLCSRVAYVSSVNATPYLHQLPQDLRVYARLLGSFSIKKDFSSRDYIQVLREMYDASVLPLPLSSTTPPAKLGGTAQISDNVTSVHRTGTEAVSVLSESKIDLAVSLVTLLSAEGGINPDVLTIYAPDSTGRLAHSTSLINDDVPWLSGPECGASRVGCRFIHPNISSLVARKLGKTCGLCLLLTTEE
jgi:hypothetical protein